MSQYQGEDVGGGKTDRVVRIIRNDIYSGELRDGDVLPATTKLAAQFGVSPGPINKAMAILTDEGLIVTEDRSRRIVRSPIKAQAVKPTRPHTFLIGGYAGSGKSELARVLAKMTGSAIVDKDTITRPVVERLLRELGQPSHDRESAAYLEHVRPFEYEATIAAIDENAASGVGVVATAPFIREFKDPAWVDRVTARLNDAGIDLTIVWVRCDVDTMRYYLNRRGAARDTNKLEDWADYVAGLDLAYEPHGPHVIVENSGSSEPLMAQVDRMLAAINATDQA